MTTTFLLASARSGGNSEQLARRAASTLPSDRQQHWLTLRDYPLEPFLDLRHADEPYPAPTGNARILADATLGTDSLVIVTPVYWYSTPAPLKLYLDYWSHWMRVESLNFKERMAEKTMWVVAASAGSAEDAQPMIDSLKLSARFLNMTWGGHVLGNGSKPGDILNDAPALEAALKLFAPE